MDPGQLIKQTFPAWSFLQTASTGDYWDSFETCLESATDQNHDVIIMGDFNHDMNITSNANKLAGILNKFNLETMINEPTKITDTSQTCIDLKLTNHTSMINSTEFYLNFVATIVL